MKKYINKACLFFKKYGVIKGLIRIVGSLGHEILLPFYICWIKKCTKIDEKKLVFSSTPSFSDNAKALYEYLYEKKELQDAKFVWLINMNDDIPRINVENVKFMRAGVFFHKGMPMKALYEVATSKYVFFTHSSPVSDLGDIRKGQIVINLWHGCGYKEVQKEAKSYFEKHPFDYALVPGKVFVETKAKSWKCDPCRIIAMGYPRYDLLMRESVRAKEYAKQLKGDAEKLVVWMPTFRNVANRQFPEAEIERGFDLPLLNSEKELELLNLFCKLRNICLCVKRHPYQVVYSCENKKYSNICFINNDDIMSVNVDLYSFLRYTDGLISDYSSVAIDYLLLDRPMAFALDDYEDYQNTRGFVFENPLKYMAGHYLYGYEDMEKFLNDITKGNDCYAVKRAEVMPFVHNVCDNYCERVWVFVKRKLQ